MKQGMMVQGAGRGSGVGERRHSPLAFRNALLSWRMCSLWGLLVTLNLQGKVSASPSRWTVLQT